METRRVITTTPTVYRAALPVGAVLQAMKRLGMRLVWAVRKAYLWLVEHPAKDESYEDWVDRQW